MAFDRRETAFLLIGDFLILSASLWIALLLRNLSIPSFSYFESNFTPFLPVFLLSLAVFYIAGLYEKQTRPIRRVMGPRILGAQVATVSIAAVLFFILPLSIAPKTILVIYLIVSVVAESVWRFNHMKYEIKENELVPALLVGSGQAVLELYEEVNENRRYTIKFMDRIGTEGLSEGAVSDMITKKIRDGIRVVVVDTSDQITGRNVHAFYNFITNNIKFIGFSSLYEEIFDRVPLEHLDASQLLETLPKQRALYDATKRIFDIILAIAGSIVAIPFICVVAFFLSLRNGSPFIHHKRIGKGGKTFRIIKLRSMLFDDHGDLELQKKNRVTTFGKFLRKTRIDELPQLWNILVGDLSFIGPRPELPKIADVYEREIQQYRLRHMITPGLSGWAQINDADPPRGSADVERTRRKLSFDLYYLKHRSFGLDLAIATKTLRTLLSFSGT